MWQSVFRGSVLFPGLRMETVPGFAWEDLFYQGWKTQGIDPRARRAELDGILGRNCFLEGGQALAR